METEGHEEDENMKNEQIDLIKGERPSQQLQLQEEAQEEEDSISAGEPKSTATGIENAPAEDQSTELRLSDFQVVDTLGVYSRFFVVIFYR
jgi:hypothetical protein